MEEANARKNKPHWLLTEPNIRYLFIPAETPHFSLFSFASLNYLFPSFAFLPTTFFDTGYHICSAFRKFFSQPGRARSKRKFQAVRQAITPTLEFEWQICHDLNKVESLSPFSFTPYLILPRPALAWCLFIPCQNSPFLSYWT